MIDHASKQYILDHAERHKRIEERRSYWIDFLREAGKYLPESSRKWTSEPTVLKGKK